MLYKKGETIKYPNGEYEVKAIVRTRHRDGTATVEAQHFVKDGKVVGAYLGYKYRLPVSDFRYYV